MKGKRELSEKKRSIMENPAIVVWSISQMRTSVAGTGTDRQDQNQSHRNKALTLNIRKLEVVSADA